MRRCRWAPNAPPMPTRSQRDHIVHLDRAAVVGRCDRWRSLGGGAAPKMRARPPMQRAPRFVITAAVFAVGSFTAFVAHAHFMMSEPTNWLVQNGSGDPQKTAPCGMQTGAVQTNAETTYKAGDMVTI